MKKIMLPSILIIILLTFVDSKNYVCEERGEAKGEISILQKYFCSKFDLRYIEVENGKQLTEADVSMNNKYNYCMRMMENHFNMVYEDQDSIDKFVKQCQMTGKPDARSCINEFLLLANYPRCFDMKSAAAMIESLNQITMLDAIDGTKLINLTSSMWKKFVSVKGLEINKCVKEFVSIDYEKNIYVIQRYIEWNEDGSTYCDCRLIFQLQKIYDSYTKNCGWEFEYPSFYYKAICSDDNKGKHVWETQHYEVIAVNPCLFDDLNLVLFLIHGYPIVQAGWGYTAESLLEWPLKFIVEFLKSKPKDTKYDLKFENLNILTKVMSLKVFTQEQLKEFKVLTTRYSMKTNCIISIIDLFFNGNYKNFNNYISVSNDQFWRKNNNRDVFIKHLDIFLKIYSRTGTSGLSDDMEECTELEGVLKSFKDAIYSSSLWTADDVTYILQASDAKSLTYDVVLECLDFFKKVEESTSTFPSLDDAKKTPSYFRELKEKMLSLPKDKKTDKDVSLPDLCSGKHENYNLKDQSSAARLFDFVSGLSPFEIPPTTDSSSNGKESEGK